MDDTSLISALDRAERALQRVERALGDRQPETTGRDEELRAKVAAAGLPAMPSVTHIVPLLVGCPVKAKKISDILLAEYGL